MMTTPRDTQCKCGHPASAHAGEHCDPCCYPANGDKCRHDFAPLASAPVRAEEATCGRPVDRYGWYWGACGSPAGHEGLCEPLTPPAAVEGAAGTARHTSLMGIDIDDMHGAELLDAPEGADLTALDPVAIKDRRNRVMLLNFALAKDGERAYRMSIPARPDDSDLLLFAICADVDRLLHERLALIAERDEARADTRRINRLEHYGDAVLIGLEPEYAGEPRFSFRDMATPPSRESLDGTLYGQTVREVLDAARRDGQ
jgi:hypothetical protein